MNRNIVLQLIICFRLVLYILYETYFCNFWIFGFLLRLILWILKPRAAGGSIADGNYERSSSPKTSKQISSNQIQLVSPPRIMGKHV